MSLLNWTLESYYVDCLTNNDAITSQGFYWLVNGVIDNSMYTPIELLYNNTLLVYPDPLGVSVNVTCIATYGKVNYSQSVILHGMIIL